MRLFIWAFFFALGTVVYFVMNKSSNSCPVPLALPLFLWKMLTDSQPLSQTSSEPPRTQIRILSKYRRGRLAGYFNSDLRKKWVET